MVLKELIESFRLNTKFLFAVLTDMTYYVILFFAIMWYTPRYILPKYAELVTLMQQANAAQSIIPQNMLPNLTVASTSIIVHIIILTITLFIAYTITKGTVWHLIADKRPHALTYFKLAAINFVVFGILFLVFYLGPKTQSYNAYAIFVLIFLPLVWHVINVSHPVTMELGLKNGCLYPFTRIQYFIFPYLIVILLFFALFFAIVFINLLKTKVIAAFSIILMIVFFTWAKNYFFQIVKTLK